VVGRLAALRREPAPRPARWWHWVLELDHKGRLTLPPEARQIGTGGDVRAWSCGGALLLRPAGVGAAMALDRRGRVLLPEWLRPVDAVFVAARRPEIEPTFSPGTRRTYRSYWLLAERFYGARPLDTITADDVERVVLAAAERARAKRILENPAREVNKPRRHPSNLQPSLHGSPSPLATTPSPKQ
jgi:hypothetical protein